MNNRNDQDEIRQRGTDEPSYGIIWRSIMARKVVPFLGAGASLVGRTKPFCEDDLRDPIRLANHLRQPQDALSRYLRERFSPEAVASVDLFNPSSEVLPLQRALVRELNQLIEGKSIYDEQRFGQVRLAEETCQLIKQAPMGEEIIRLNRYLLEDAYPAEIVKRQREWTAQAHAFLPSGVELSQYIAYEAEFPSDNPYDLGDLAKVSSYYVGRGPRDTLRNLLRTVINHDYQVGRLHRFLANIPVPLVIVTTNYDTLIEQAFRTAGKVYDLVIYPNDGKVTSEWANAVLWWPHGEAQPTFRETNQLEKDIDLDKTTVIYKMHGTIIRGDSDEWDTFVITEDDYAEFLSRMTTQGAIPSLFRSHFRGRSFLFLGYGLRDWNLRVLLTSLKQRQRGEAYDDQGRSWAIQRRPSTYERILWNRRNVDIFDLTLDEFVRKMEARQDLG